MARSKAKELESILKQISRVARFERVLSTSFDGKTMETESWLMGTPEREPFRSELAALVARAKLEGPTPGVFSAAGELLERARAAQPVKDERKSTDEQAAQLECLKAQRAQWEQDSAERGKRKAAVMALAPAGCNDVIVADYEVPQEFSHNMSRRKRVALAFSMTSRDMFPELRKAAARFAETADLEHAPKNAEHRCKYSMGAGFYLSTADFREGWKVRKVSLDYNADTIDDVTPLLGNNPTYADKARAELATGVRS